MINKYAIYEKSVQFIFDTLQKKKQKKHFNCEELFKIYWPTVVYCRAVAAMPLISICVYRDVNRVMFSTSTA